MMKIRHPSYQQAVINDPLDEIYYHAHDSLYTAKETKAVEQSPAVLENDEKPEDS